MRRGLTLHSGIGGQDHFAEGTGVDTRQQFGNADGFRAQTIERGQMPLEYEITAAVAGLLHRMHIHRPLDDAQQAVIAALVQTQLAQFVFAQAAAALAVAHAFHRSIERLSQTLTATAIAFEQLQRHALRGLLADSGQDTQGVDQLANQGAEAHGSPAKVGGQ